MKILVVEDDYLVACFVEDALTAAGHEVLGPADSFKAAIEISDSETPDIALVDINLSGNKTGIELSRELHTRHVPSVLMSGNSLDDDAKQFAVGSLAKPYRLDSMIDTVEFVRCQLAGVTLPALPRGFVIFRPYLLSPQTD